MKEKKLIFIFSVFLLTFFICNKSFALTAKEYEEPVIEMLNSFGIMQGTDKGFEPKKSLTRSEAAAIFVRLYGYEYADMANYNENNFTDVSDTHWAKQYINKAVELGIMKGVGNRLFNPDKEVTLGELYTMAVRSVTTDEQIDIVFSEYSWPENYYRFCLEENMLNNIENPETYYNSSTRIQAAMIIASVLESPLWVKSTNTNEVTFFKGSETFEEAYLQYYKVSNIYITAYGNDDGKKFIKWKYNNKGVENENPVWNVLDLSTLKKNEYYDIVIDKRDNAAFVIYNAKTGKAIKQLPEEERNNGINASNVTNSNEIEYTMYDVSTMIDNFEDANYTGTHEQKMSQFCEHVLSDIIGLSFDASFSTASHVITNNDVTNNNSYNIKIDYLILSGYDANGNITSSCTLNFGFIIDRKDTATFKTNIKYPDNTVTWGVTGFKVKLLKD